MNAHIETIAITVVTYFFLRYIWESRLRRIFDRWFKPMTQSEVHSHLDLLIEYFSTDWLSVHVLPNPQVYKPLCKEIRSPLIKYLGQRELIIYDELFLVYDQRWGNLERPKPVEIVAAQDFINSELVPILKRIQSQILDGDDD